MENQSYAEAVHNAYNRCFLDRALIALYHARGESERFRSELKSDMNLDASLPESSRPTRCLWNWG